MYYKYVFQITGTCISKTTTNVPSSFSKSVYNILPGLVCIWNDVYEICANHFFKKHLCALQLVCTCT